MQTNEPTPNPNQQTSSSQPTDASLQQQPGGISPPTQESPKIKKSNKWLIIGLGVFALVALGIAGVFTYQNYQLKKQVEKPTLAPEITPTRELQPTPTSATSIPLPTPITDPTANWKIYKDEGNKYELKYPQDWHLLKRPGPVTSFSNSESGEEKDWIVVSIFKNTDVNVDSLDSTKKYYEDEPGNYLVLGDITIDGLPGFEIEFLKKLQREAIIAGDLNEVPQDIFTLFVTYDQDKKDNALDIYQKILSTFKFTN